MPSETPRRSLALAARRLVLVAALGVLILNIVLPTCWNVAVGRGIDVENTFRMTGLYHTRRMLMF